MKPNPDWEKWCAWLGREPGIGTIYDEVVGMTASRQAWEMFQAVVEVAPEKARKYSTFHSWVNGNYVRSQGLAIRRQL